MNTTSKLFDMTQLAEASYTRFREAAVLDSATAAADLIDLVNRGGNFSSTQPTARPKWPGPHSFNALFA